ncbi:MAG TPA: hypothetical protein PKA82_01285 [Pyrinomonadaceae bacterium]|nr:hypothetical protein [Pyrinomonadaceae bacterium]
MNKLTIFILVFTFSAATVFAQNIANSVRTIDDRYKDIASKATACETDDDQGEYGPLVMNTLTINSRSHQWRAVGIYGQTFKFFYQGGDDEKDLYPNKLVFVKTERRVSDRVYREEYLFSDKGELQYFARTSENDDQSPKEIRIYTEGMRALRIIENGKSRDKFSTADIKAESEARRDAAKIKDLFARSIAL